MLLFFSPDVPDSEGTEFRLGFPPHDVASSTGDVFDVTRLVLLASDGSPEVNVTISGPVDIQVTTHV